MKAELVINVGETCKRFEPRYHRAQKFIDSEVLRDCEPYVPKRNGDLIKSGNTGTVIGSGKVIYNAPYAKRCYYALHVEFSKAKNPKACAQWFEAAKAAKKTAWKNGVEKIIKGEE